MTRIRLWRKARPYVLAVCAYSIVGILVLMALSAVVIVVKVAYLVVRM